MQKISLIAILLALFAACSPSLRTRALAIASSTTIVLDWHQTIGITRECDELNPVIGECGERTDPNLYFTVALLAHLAVGAMLPEPWRDVWFSSIAGAQASTVVRNWRRK